MEQNNSKIEVKDMILSFYNLNKKKIIFIIIVISIILITINVIKINNKKNNNLISEKYVQAELYFESGKKEKAKQIYVDIIMNKNTIYSILALNTILENNLEINRDKVLNYFDIILKKNISKDQSDIIKLKKSLYLIKNSNVKAGKDLLKKLINNNSKLKLLAEEILKN